MNKLILVFVFTLFCFTASRAQFLSVDTAFTTDVGYNNAPASCVAAGYILVGAWASITQGYSIAEDFIVPVGQTWTVDSVRVFAFQTTSGIISTINAGRIRIWRGRPDSAGAVIVFSDLTPTALKNSGWTGIYRVYSPNILLNNLPIMRVTLNGGGTVLTPGRYFVEFWLGGTGSDGPSTPPKVLPGRLNPSNQFSLQRNINTNVWSIGYDQSRPIGFSQIVMGSKVVTSCSGPTDLNATNITSTSATLRWTSYADLFNVKYNIGSNFDPNTSGTPVSPNPVTTTCNISGLTPNQTVYWYVRAVCSPTMPSSWSGPHTFNATCPVPANLEITDRTDSSAMLKWTSIVSLFDIELRETGIPPTGNPTVSGIGNPYKYTGLLPSKDYYYYVRSNCGEGIQSAWAGPFNFSTLPYNPYLAVDTAFTTDMGWNGRNASCVFTGGNILGLACQIGSNFNAYDDFNVPAGQTWRLDSIRLFVYNNSDTNTNYNAGKIRIWKNRPDSAGSTLIFVDTSATAYLSTKWTRIYRVKAADLFESNYAIKSVTLNAGGVSVGPGNYWIQYQIGGTGSGGIETPFKVLPGRINPPNQNAMLRHIGGTWIYSTDGGQRIGFNLIVMGRNITSISVQSLGGNIPEKYELSQNYPNPFNPVTKIRFAIPKSEFVAIKVYDLIGREIATLLNEQKNPGYYEVEFDGSNLSSGMYFYKITAGNFTNTKKMILLK